MLIDRSSKKWPRGAAGAALLIAFGAAKAGAASDRCDIVIKLMTPIGTVVEIKYDLPQVSGQPCLCKVTVEAASGVEGDVGNVSCGVDKFARAQFPAPRDPKEVHLIAEAVRRPSMGISWFTSIEPRQSTPSLGQRQALGGVVALGFPFRRSLELAVEASGPLARSSYDSELFTSFSERRFFSDTLVSVLAGRPVDAGNRIQVVPMAGIGIAALSTDRDRYSVSNGLVQTVTDHQWRVMPAATVGFDLRVGIWQGLRLVVQDRLHVLAGSSDSVAPRPRIQHRPGVGIQFSLGSGS